MLHQQIHVYNHLKSYINYSSRNNTSQVSNPLKYQVGGIYDYRHKNTLL